ncbi:MAG: hypothetical protein O2951_18610 [Bacteroidetes bacterium]|nr:hypothetical protein [Bacteroidota bacterium]
MKILENGFELMSNVHHTNVHLVEIAALKSQNQNLTKAVSSQKLMRNVFIAIAVGFALFVVWDQSQKSKTKDD